jgi:hypothetical protein
MKLLIPCHTAPVVNTVTDYTCTVDYDINVNANKLCVTRVSVFLSVSVITYVRYSIENRLVLHLTLCRKRRSVSQAVRDTNANTSPSTL